MNDSKSLIPEDIKKQMNEAQGKLDKILESKTAVLSREMVISYLRQEATRDTPDNYDPQLPIYMRFVADYLELTKA